MNKTFFVVMPDWTRLSSDQRWDLAMLEANAPITIARAYEVWENVWNDERFISFQIKATGLHDVYDKLNSDVRPVVENLRPFAQLRSLSVGDMVVNKETGKVHLVSRIGFVEMEGMVAEEFAALAEMA